MKRAKSDVPVRVYKYMLLPPTENAELVLASFKQGRAHYNRLITIELVARRRYREARTRLFPEYADLEAKAAECDAQVEAARAEIKAAKGRTKSRKVDPEAAKNVKRLAAELKVLRARLKDMRKELAKSPELQAASEAAHAEADTAIKALRKEMYWGTYNLLEKSAKQASKDSVRDPEYNTKPDHILNGRLGVQFIGGLSVEQLANDTQMQISPMPTFRVRPSGVVFARGKAARTTLKFRIGSEGKRNTPVFATFPMIMHRPLPEGCRIQEAYLVRRPGSARVPWRYHLCIVMRSSTFERTRSTPAQVGTSSINFGWRLIDGEIRVATINRVGSQPFDIRLPSRILSGTLQCNGLRSLLATKFNAAKKALSEWIASGEVACPDGFKEAFGHVAIWKSQHRLADLVWYWNSHRFAGDEAIFTIMNEWKDRYRHLADWEYHLRRRLLDWRQNFYREWAKKLACTNSMLIVDDFEISKVVKKKEAEEVDDSSQMARTIHQLAAPGEFRLAIAQGCAKYHCRMEAAIAVNNTRRCHVCGELYQWEPKVELVHTCPGVSSLGPVCSTWDQDVNNTANLLKIHRTTAELVPLVTPASAGDDLQPATISKTRPYKDVRADLRGVAVDDQASTDVPTYPSPP